MTYQDRNGRPRGGSSIGDSSRRYSGGARARVPSQSVYHGPTGTRTRSGRPRGGKGRGGYPLKARSINFQGGRNRIFGLDRGTVILGALAVVLLVLVIVGVSSCVRGCTSGQQAESEVNPVDSRVAAGVSEELTQRFATELNRNEKLSQIASTANEYSDTGLLELALDVPEAIDFVAAYPTAEKTAQPYDGEVSKGTVPELWCWDARWGNVDYAGRALALTGSGPTALSAAYMGLTGSSDRTPADIAQAVSDAELASGDASMSGEYLTSHAADLGLECNTYTSNADNLSQMLDAGTYLLIETKAGTITEDAHWIVLVTENEDGTVVVHDPTSPEVGKRAWAPSTLASSCDTLYVLSVAETDEADTTE